MIEDYNSLIQELSSSFVKDADSLNFTVSSDKIPDIKRHLNNVRTGLITLGCLYEERNEDCKCILNDFDTVNQFDLEGNQDGTVPSKT